MCTNGTYIKLSLEKAHDKSKFKVVDDKKMDNSEKESFRRSNVTN